MLGKKEIYEELRARELKTRHNFESLLKTNAKILSDMAPWTKFNPENQSRNSGQWRLMESPIFFMVKNRLIYDPNKMPFKLAFVFDCGETESLYAASGRVFEDSGKFEFVLPEKICGTEEEEIEKFEKSFLIPRLDSPYLNKKGVHVNNFIDNKGLTNILAKQLGKPIARTGNTKSDIMARFAGLSENEKWITGITAALLARGFSKNGNEQARRIFDAMNYSVAANEKGFVPESIDICDAEEIIELLLGKLENDERFVKKCLVHASWTNTFIVSLLVQARTRGVLETGKFGWLKSFDRSLWYALVQTGRQTASIEAAGVYSHFMIEEVLEKSFETPVVGMAVDGIKNTLIREGWLPEK